MFNFVINNCKDKVVVLYHFSHLVPVFGSVSASEILVRYAVCINVYKGSIRVRLSFAESGGLSGAAVFAGRPGICG